VYLSRLLLNARDYQVRCDLANCQELHRTLLSAFPTAGGSRAEAGLLFRLEEGERSAPLVIAQSRGRPDWERLRVRSPAYLLGVPPLGWDCKDVASAYASVQTGMQLRFRLRANPTRKVDTKSGPDGARRNGRRTVLTGADQKLDWLRRKAEAGGFRLCSVHSSDAGVPAVDVRPQDDVLGWRSAGEQRNRLVFGAVLFEGVLEVTDAERFREALRDGIGSGKAYGFGLLSIAPA